MKISAKKAEFLCVLVLYLSALYIWTLPMHNNRMPFGDVDASSHFTIGDYMSSYDKSIAKIPYPIEFRYGGQNSMFPGYLWYPPQYWTSMAIAQAIGGDRILPFFIMVAIFCSIIILSLYFLTRKLFGFWAAFLSSFLLIFSTRDYMVYLWGQWPQSLSFAFTPLVLYCFYLYYISQDRNSTYMYMLALFLSAQFFFHPQGMIASIGALSVFCIMLAIRDKKLPFTLKHAAFSVILFVAISAAFAPLNVGEFFSEIAPGKSGTEKPSNVDKLFKWYQGIKNDAGLPDFYFTYNKAHGSLDGTFISWWTLPLLFLGLFALAYRKKTEDILFLSWFISFYFLTRLVVFGFGGRDIRMFAYEAHVFYPIIVVGLLSISSFAKKEQIRRILKFGLIVVFIVMAIAVNGKSAYEVLSGMQYSIGRINPWQYEAASWLMENTDEKADIYDIGTLGYQNYAAKIKWMGVLSQRHFIVNDHERNMTDYLVLDYTDALLLKDQNYINMLQGIEAQIATQANGPPVYDKNNIKVYKVAGLQI